MHTFVAAVRQAVKDSNWLAALATALTLPDICGWLEAPQATSRARYESWFGKYVEDCYTGMLGPRPRMKHVFLSGADCYALRCSLLHEGSNSTERQQARQALTRFRFVAPPADGGMRHINQAGSVLQLQVDLFCEDMCKGVDSWMAAVLIPNSDACKRLEELLRIENLEGGIGL